METQDAKQVASILYNEIITRYGAPSILVSDRRRNFLFKLITMMAFRMSPATESISLSIFHMVFGREMNMPVDTALVP